MGEKKSKKIGVLIFFLILAIIVIIVMGYFMYNDKQAGTDRIANLNNEITAMQNTINELEEKIKDMEDEKNSKISISGIYVDSPSGTDVIYQFMDNGFVEISSNTTLEQGYYTTTGKDEIEIVLSKETATDIDTNEETITQLNETIKAKIVNDITLSCEREINGENISFNLYKIRDN